MVMYWGLTKESDDNEEQVIEKSAVICIPTSVELLGILFCFQLGADVEILLKNQDSRWYERGTF